MNILEILNLVSDVSNYLIVLNDFVHSDADFKLGIIFAVANKSSDKKKVIN